MKKRKDRVTRIEADPGWEERVKKSLKETWVELQPPPRRPLSPKCCPHCLMHEPIGA